MIKPEEWVIGLTVAALAAVVVVQMYVTSPGTRSETETPIMYAAAASTAIVITLAPWAARGNRLDRRDRDERD